MKLNSPTSPIVLAFVSAVFLLLTWPVWRWLWGEWMGNDYYSHGLLIVPVSIYLVVQRFRHDDELLWPPAKGSNRGWFLLLPSFVAYLYFLNDRAYYLAAFATIGLIGGIVWTMWGDLTARKLLFPLAYLLFMVPLPFIERWTLPLAMFTGVCSGAAVQFFGLDIEIVGNAVTLPNANLVIGAQCSGINSLIALLALAVLAAYLLDGPPWARLMLVILAVPLSMLGNILRVASLLVVARFYGADTGFIFYHDYSGPIFFLLSISLMALAGWLMGCRSLRDEVI